MSWRDDFSTVGLSQLIAVLGEPAVVYQPANAAASTIAAIVSPDPDVVQDAEDGELVRRSITVKLQASDIPSPAQGDVITWGGTKWGFHSRQNIPGGFACTFLAAGVRGKGKPDRFIRR